MENKFNNKNVSKPNIELHDFYEILDPKVVEKIKSTSEESRSRIIADINEFQSHLQK
jgi:undecaprenyl pyrophosphate synthase